MRRWSKKLWDDILGCAARSMRDVGYDVSTLEGQGEQVLSNLEAMYWGRDPHLWPFADYLIGWSCASSPERKSFVRRWNRLHIRLDRRYVAGFVMAFPDGRLIA